MKSLQSRREILISLASTAAIAALPHRLLGISAAYQKNERNPAGGDCHPLPKPTSFQHAWQDMEVGMFIHMSPQTFSDKHENEGAVGDPKDFNPSSLDTEQWVSVAESMGAHYIILVAKHIGGFCLWPTKTTDYSIASSPYKGGKGDILGELASTCKKRNMRLGVYVCPRDDYHKVGNSGIVRSGNSEEQARYDAMYSAQLAEIGSKYGSLVEIWFDGSAKGELIGPIVHRYQPNAMIFNTSAGTIRYVGNEEGVAPYPLWNTVSVEQHASGQARGPGDPSGQVWLPAECDVSIRKNWFWSPTNGDTLKSLDKLMDVYYKTVGRGGNLLLNETPDRRGLIPEADATRTRELGNEIRRRFSKALAQTKGNGSQILLNLPKSSWIDHVIIKENLTEGQRIRKYKLEALQDGKWILLVEGESIGHKKIEQFSRVQTSKVRLNITSSVCEPRIDSLAAYLVGA